MQARIALETCQRELGDINEATGGVAAKSGRRDGGARTVDRANSRPGATAGGGVRSGSGDPQARHKELAEEVRVVEDRAEARGGDSRSGRRQPGELETRSRRHAASWTTRQAALTDLEQEFRDALTHGADAEAREGVSRPRRGD